MTHKRRPDLVNNAIRRATHRLDMRRHAQKGVSLAILALAAFATAGCEAPRKTDPTADGTSSAAPGSKSTTKTAASKTEPKALGSRSGPQRLEAGRASSSSGATSGAGAGSGATPARASTVEPKPAATQAALANDSTSGLINPGDEVDGNVGAERIPVAARARASRDVNAPAGDGSPPARDATPEERAAAARLASGRAKTMRSTDGAVSNPNAAFDERPTWSVLLASFTGEDHRANATSAREQISKRFPAMKECYVRTTTRGSVVLIGRFDGPQDPAAQVELKRVKEFEQDGSKVFGRAMLTRLGASADLSPPGPNDLRSVRVQAPKATLYTLQVAVWSALGTDEMKMSEIKRSAEGYCKQLRTQGYESYYFHDFDTKTSVVTVGVFGADSYDSKSTLYSPDVEAVMKKFPKHLVNGEELLMPTDPRNPNGKTIPQAPRLVEVPKF